MHIKKITTTGRWIQAHKITVAIKDWSETKSTTQSVGHFSIVSGHFFANYINIFHNIELQMVILMCLTLFIWIKKTT